MSALTFTLTTSAKQRIDCSPLTTDTLTGKSLAEIAAIEVLVGNRYERADSVFDISGDDAADIKFANSTDKLDFVGRNMTTGKILVDGNVGAYFGLFLEGGQLEVTGNTDVYTACEMKSGQIKINGNAGDFLGGARPGRRNGMTGGTVIVKGNTGDRTGDHMRRGVILIEGNAGDYCAGRMISGTIAVLGDVGAHLGMGMKRGTVLLTQLPSRGITANFNDCGSHTLAFLPLLFASFKKLDSQFASVESFSRVQRYAGDLAGIGMGEILVKI
ncbi:MAG: formylmethanofuran dehydrogenase subunit C [Gammaproteobacteria bacterium]|nr:MAG: formylmethanofuran dehydrogenase subunit C [Gammaproteobacteria bacterium]